MTTETTPTAAVQTANITSPIVTDGVQPVVTSPVVDAVTAPAPVAVDPAVEPVVDDNIAPKTTPKWAQDRINELTAKRHAAERQAEVDRNRASAAEAKAAELLAQISKGGTPPVVDPNAAKPMTEEEIDRRVTEKAAQMAQVAAFTDACNKVVEVGKKEFAATWDEAIKNLGLVGALGKDVSPDFLETAIELKNPAKVLNYLGKNLEEAEKIVKSSPKKMALEMARLEAQLDAPVAAAPLPPVSNAPVPVIPVVGAAKPGAKDINDPTLSTEEFMALRAEQRDARNKRYQRV